MIRKDLHYLSADRKTKIHFIEWLPEGFPKAVIQISHGITEHIGRYEKLASFLVDKGCAVVGNDQIGHGTSAEGEIRSFRWEFLVRDTRRLQEYMKQQYPTIPYYVIGFSMGSFVIRDLLARFPDGVDAAVLIGTGLPPSSQVSFARSLVSLEARRVGDGKTSRLVKALSFGAYNRYFRPNKTDYDWLCQDIGGLDDYLNDRLCGKSVPAGLFRELLRGMLLTGKTESIEKIRDDLPILLLSGENDPVGEMGEGVQRFQETLKNAGIRDITMNLYPGRHDILHEACREHVLEDMAEWLEGLYWQEYF